MPRRRCAPSPRPRRAWPSGPISSLVSIAPYARLSAPLEASASAPRPQLARGPTSRDEAVGALRARQPRRRIRVGRARLLLLLRRRDEDRLRHRALALVPPTSSSRRSGRQRPPPLRSRRRDAEGRHAAPSAVPCAQRQTACAGRIAEHLTHAGSRVALSRSRPTSRRHLGAVTTEWPAVMLRPITARRRPRDNPPHFVVILAARAGFAETGRDLARTSRGELVGLGQSRKMGTFEAALAFRRWKPSATGGRHTCEALVMFSSSRRAPQPLPRSSTPRRSRVSTCPTCCAGSR